MWVYNGQDITNRSFKGADGTTYPNNITQFYTPEQLTQIGVTWVDPMPVQFTYQELRAMAYPPIADYLDGIVKGDQAQIDKYIADCLAVKLKYPKPT